MLWHLLVMCDYYQTPVNKRSARWQAGELAADAGPCILPQTFTWAAKTEC